MAKLFFIWGLPRCRTAWLSNLFTHGDVSLCFHDACRSAGGSVELLTQMSVLGEDYEFVGDSDNGLPVYEDFLTLIPDDTPIALVYRDPAEVVESLVKMHEGELSEENAWAVVTRSREAMDRAVGREGACTYSFSRLDDLEVLAHMWEHLMPGTRFPRERAHQLQHLNVQLHKPAYLDTMSVEFAEQAVKFMEDA